MSFCGGGQSQASGWNGLAADIEKLGSGFSACSATTSQIQSLLTSLSHLVEDLEKALSTGNFARGANCHDAPGAYHASMLSSGSQPNHYVKPDMHMFAHGK